MESLLFDVAIMLRLVHQLPKKILEAFNLFIVAFIPLQMYLKESAKEKAIF